MINVKIDDIRNKKFTNFLWILFAIMITFTTSDLICGFTGNLTFALIFSCLSGAVVVYGNLKTRKIELDENLDTIKKSFNNSNIIFAVLDIACSIVALLTGIVFLGLIFRAIWAIRITVIINKFRTVARILQIGSFAYLIKRRFYMKKWLKANKWSIISGLGFGGLTSFAGWSAIKLYWLTAPLWATILILSAAAIIAFVLVYCLGREVYTKYALRIATKFLPNENVSQLTDFAIKMTNELKAAEEEAEAKKQAEARIENAKKIVEELENAKKILEESETAKSN